MRIVIDARLYGSRHTGIGRYSQNLVEHLIKLQTKHDFFLITHREAKTNPQSNLTVITTDIPYYGYQEQFRLISLLKNINPDIVHFTHFNHPVFYNSPFVITIHDLIKSDFKDYSASTRGRYYYEFKHAIYRKVISHGVKKSRAIITPSDYSKSRILAHYPNISEQKIRVIYEGVDQFLKHRTKKVFDYKKYSIIDNYALYVGNSYPYKNLETAIKAVKKINRLQLVVVSKSNPNLFNLKKLASSHPQKFVFLEEISDDELSELYSNAKFFLFPTKSEGFGIPGLEAMALGTPVLSSNAGPLPEIYQNAASYFDPYSVNDLTDKIGHLLKNYETLAPKMIKAGKLQTKKYSWNITAKQTLATYENCLSL